MKNPSFLRLQIAIVFLMFASGCSILPGSATVEPPSHKGWIFFQDDFSTSPNGWGTLGSEGGTAAVNYGGMVIRVENPGSLFWTINEGHYADTKIDVDAVLLNGPTNDNFGVICRFVDNRNFYGFLISHDGYFGIFKMLDGEMTLGGNKTNMDFSEAIRQGGVVNHISATCNGNILKLTVNDELLAELQDGSFSSGQLGLIAGAYDQAGVEVLFDNLRVTQP